MAQTKGKGDKDVGIADVIKKVVSIGVGAAFMTEDAVKSLLSDLPLPKDMISGLIQNAKSAKEDFSQSIREELKGHLSKVDPKALVSEIIENYDIEVTAKFKFAKKETNSETSKKKNVK